MVVPEYCIDKLGQNHVIPQYDFFFTMGKIFLGQTYNKILTTSLEIFYYQEYSKLCETNAISTIHIVVDGDHGQEKFWSVCKFILRYMNVINIDSYIIKNDRIDCEKETSELLNDSFAKALNDEIKIMMNEDMFIFLNVEWR